MFLIILGLFIIFCLLFDTAPLLTIAIVLIIVGSILDESESY